MRILLIILLSINTCFGQQTWVSLSSNQGVSWGALTDAVSNGIFTTKNTLPTNGLYRLIERDSIAYYVNIDTTNSGFTSRSNNQMVQQSDLIPLVTSCGSTYYGLSWSGNVAYKGVSSFYMNMGTTSGTSNINITYHGDGSYGASIYVDYPRGTNVFSQSIQYASSSGSFTYTYNATYGQEAYVYIYANSGVNEPGYSFDVTLGCPSGTTYYNATWNQSPTTYSTCSAALSAATGGNGVYMNTNFISSGATKIYTDYGITPLPYAGGNYYSITFSGTKYAVTVNSGGTGQVVYAYTTCPSDVRLKTHIKYLYTNKKGLRIYRFAYKKEPNVYYEGVMAQDLLKSRKYAKYVVKDDDGYYSVIYDLLGIKLIKVR
jgi:hypothetical protein